MSTIKVQVGLRLTEDAYAKVKVIAKAEKRAVNNLIEYVVQRYIDDYEAQNGPVEILEKE